MATISTMVSNRLAWARRVLTALTEHRDELLDALEDHYDRASLEQFLDDLYARLEEATERMRTRELELAEELADDDAVRDHRDDLKKTLRSYLFSASDRIENTFGESAVDSYGLSETPPRQPDDLVAYTSNVLHSLHDSRRTGEDPFGDEVDTQRIVETLQEPLDEFEKTLEQVDRERRAAHSARNVRNEAVDEWEFVFRGTADTLSGLFLLAGRDDLAERVRPTRQATSGRKSPPDESAEESESGETAEADSGESSGDGSEASDADSSEETEGS